MEVLRNSAPDGTLKFEGVSLLDACRFLHRAWDSVTANCIRNCFEHAGLTSNHYEEEDKVPLKEWLQQFDVSMELASFIDFNEEIITTEERGDQNIVDEVLRNEILEEAESDEEDIVKQVPTIRESLGHIQHLISFYQSGDSRDDPFLKNLYVIENDLEKKFASSRTKKQKLTDFFKQA